MADPRVILRDGPLLSCEIRVDAKRAQALVQAGEDVPEAVKGDILIDTGASMTSIDRDVLTQLGIPDIGDANVLTPSGGETQKVFPCGLAFPGTTVPSISHVLVLGANLSQQAIVGLIGRDILARGVLIYNGSAGIWTLAF